MTGLDLPVKLRRGLGQGKVVPAIELESRLGTYDGDGDGALTREELAKFLLDNHVGGPWFCKMMSNNLFRTAEERWTIEVASIKADALGRIIHYAMARELRPVKRYILTPAAVLGIEPKQGIDGEDPNISTEELMRSSSRRRPKAGAPRQGAPRGREGGPRRPRQGGPRQGARSGARGRPPPRGRASGRPRRSGGRGAPRGPRRPTKPRR